jgi:hypothetical protein
MRRSIVCASAVVVLGLVLLAGAVSRGSVRVEATTATPTSTLVPTFTPTFGPTPPPGPVYLALDCDVAAPGIQDNCTLGPGAAAVDVAFVLVNNTPAGVAFSAFNFSVEDPDPGRIMPPVIAGPFTDRNPDLNQAQLSGTLVCLPAEADSPLDRAGAPPGTVTSSLACYDGVAASTVPPGGQLTLATVHYFVPTTASPGAVPLALSEVAMADPQTITIIGCTYPCGGATITIVSAPAHVPSPTPTPSPTATAIASATPIVISQPPVSTPTTDMYFAIDCDLTHPGVQSDCTYRLGDASEIDVGVVLVNNGPRVFGPLSALNFAMHMPDRSRLAPLPSLSLLDGNPDFNDAGISGAWQCTPAEADMGTDGPAAAASYLSCIEPSTPGIGPVLAAGTDLALATVRYGVLASARPGSVLLRVDNATVVDFNSLSFDMLAGDCGPPPVVPAPCLPATLHLVAYPTIAKVPAGVGANVNPAVPAANLWICQVGPCGGPGEGDLVVTEHVTGVLTGDQNGDSLPDGLGAYEFQVEFDPLVILSVNPSDIVFSPGGAGAARGPANCSMSIASENLVRFACVTSGQALGPEGSFDLAKLDLVLAADDAKDLFPGNDNGMPTLIKDNQCELADVFGHPVQGTVGDAGLLPACGDLSVTVRILEGDLNLDCKVDVADEALIAEHYGASFGSAFYDRWFDVEPRFHDLDVDIKDLQKVFGRDGSTCQLPIPPQPPVVPPFSLAG